MATEVPTNTAETSSTLLSTGQGGPPSASPEPPSTPSIPSTPPAPPRNRLVARIQPMPPGGRWALGLILAFLGGVTWLALNNPSVAALSVLVTAVLTLVAGFLLGRWVAVLPLAVALAAGGFVGAWLFVQMSPTGAIEGLTGMGAVLVMLAFFAILDLVPLILFLLGGVGFGRLQGLTWGQPHALSARDARTSQWIAAFAPVVAAGAFARTLAYLPGAQFGVWFLVSGILMAVLLAVTCLLGGWLLRSWWGLVVVPVVYAGVAALAGQLTGGIIWGDVWPVGFALYVVLPAVVMSVIGTVIGMSRARQAGPSVPHGQMTT